MKKSRAISSIAVIFLIFVMVSVAVVTFVLSYRPSKGLAYASSDAFGTRYNFLIIGKDDAASLADIMIILSLDTEKHESYILQVPRDTYLNYTDRDYKKINGTLSSFGGEEALSEKLSEYFSIPIDRYVSLDIKAFESIVDTLGGVEVNVPTDMNYDDPEQGFSVHLHKGRQVLYGNEALGFVRYRSGYLMGDIARVDAQKIFAAALIKKLSDIKNPITLYNILKNVKKEVSTDICDRDALYFAYNFLLCGKDRVFIATLPGEAERSEISGAWYYIISRQASAELLKAGFGLECEEKDFDKNKNFVDTETKSFYDIYNKFYSYKLYRIDETNENGIELT